MEVKKRIAASLMAIIMMFLLSACSAVANHDSHVITAEEFREKWDISRTAEHNKVIMDVDAMYVNDDAYAILIAAQADALGYIDLLGITSTTGNAFSSASAYSALYILETIGRTDIPVYLGASMPRNGFVDIEKIKKECGIFRWYGCYASIDLYTEDVNEAYERGLCKVPGTVKNSAVMDESAVDFIIEQVHKYPGEVTLITLSSLTTISLAIEKDPTIVDDAAGIIIMGGDFGMRIDSGRDYEFNLWFDPEASNIVLSAPWKERVIASSDAAEFCKRNKGVYELLKSKNTSAVIGCIVDTLAPIYEVGEEDHPYCWDPMTIVYFLCPDVITRIEPRAVCVDEREGMTYGLTRDWFSGFQPDGVGIFDVILECDGTAFWEFISDICSMDI